MSNSSLRAPVRVRTRLQRQPTTDTSSEASVRLIADHPEARKKRAPNSGSFKKGEPSRNPQGRPKGARGKKAMVAKVLTEPVKVRLPTGQRTLTVFQALLMKERDLAFSGDWRARKTMIELGRWALPEDVLQEAGVPAETSTETDQAILAWFEEEARQKQPREGGGGNDD
jgi:hypothetical protein